MLPWILFAVSTFFLIGISLSAKDMRAELRALGAREPQGKPASAATATSGKAVGDASNEVKAFSGMWFLHQLQWFGFVFITTVAVTSILLVVMG